MQGAIKFFWDGGFEADFLFGDGMDECQHARMETETVNRRELESVTVLAVSHNGMTDRRKMDTDLVGAAGFKTEFDERIVES